MGRMVMDPPVLTVEQEEAQAAKPRLGFQGMCERLPGDDRHSCWQSSYPLAGERDSDRHPSEGPPHEVTLTKPFAVSKFEVTFEEWDACVSAGACPRVPDSWGRGTMPAINVSWRDAKEYVGWLSQFDWEGVLGFRQRPNGSTRRRLEPIPAFPGAMILAWATPIATAAVVNGTFNKPRHVGSFEPNRLGLYDMHGNVWEWVEDSWHDNYDGAPTDGSAWLRSGDPNFRVVRGGSWRNESQHVRAAIRAKRHASVRFDTLGIRVARTIKP